MESKFWIVIAVYLLLMNVIGFFSMLADKRKAQKGKWRTPEATLLLIAAIGGSIGSILGMKTFHHKTKHKKFTIGLPLILILQIALAVWLVSRHLG